MRRSVKSVKRFSTSFCLGGESVERFTEAVIHVIKNIPPGKVMSYGQIAKFAGSPRGARQVVRILHSMSGKYNLPWHRVINSKGEIGIQDEELFFTQKSLLEDEGVQFKGKNKIDMEEYRYHPDEDVYF
jgi:methylated-DNA-protein-cysteine methyltransferase related protein